VIAKNGAPLPGDTTSVIPTFPLSPLLSVLGVESCILRLTLSANTKNFRFVDRSVGGSDEFPDLLRRVRFGLVSFGRAHM
jgi:hypothetical protein